MNLSGQTLGKYDLIERLGQGGMAQVYRAVQPHIERPVAIKVLHAHLAEDPQFLLRFKREAKRLGQLRHAHIVSVIDFDVQDEQNYMVMDFVAGDTLRNVLERETVLPLEHALLIAEQVASALAYAHANRIIHRDIKPSNVMFLDVARQHAVLTDFGIARLINDARLTQSGVMAGTPAYISPEAVNGGTVDARADIYSLGVLFYELITGETPYQGDSAVSLMLKHISEPLPPIRENYPDLPEQVVQIVERALQKEPDARYQSAAALQEALQLARLNVLGGNIPQTMVGSPNTTFLEAVSVAQTPIVASPAPAIDGTASAVNGTRWRWGLVALMLLLLGVGGIWGRRVANERTQQAEVAAIVQPTPTDAPTITPTDVPVSVPQPTSTTAPTTTPTTPLPTMEPTRQPTPTPLPFVEPDSVGYVEFSADLITLFVDRVPTAPAGMHYHGWLLLQPSTHIINLGELDVVNGVIAAQLPIESMPQVAEIQIVLQFADESFVNGKPIFFRRTVSESYRNAFQELFVASTFGPALLTGVAEQSVLAFDHHNFILAAIAADDIDGAKQHTEHVVNILDGATGDLFGDLNLDGQTQNPGDGVGVRGYLEAALFEIDRAIMNEPPTLRRGARAQHARNQTHTTLERVASIMEKATRLLATDSITEAAPIATELTRLFEQLLDGPPEGDGGLTALSADVFDVSLIALQAKDAPSVIEGVPEPIANDAGRIGLLRLLQDGDYLLLTESAADDVFLWGRNSVAGDAQRLTRVTAPRTTGRLDASFDQFVLAIGDGPTLEAAQIVAQGDVRAAETDPYLHTESGTLILAETQALLAINHAGFMQEALDADNLASAKMHAEHVANILDGTAGDLFGDLNLDGQAQNPGDSIGVRGYLQQTADLATATSDRRANLETTAARLALLTEQNLVQLDAVLARLLTLLATDSTEEAQPVSAEIATLLKQLVDGVDADDSGAIDPLLGEGGLSHLLETALLLGEIELIGLEKISIDPSPRSTNRPVAKIAPRTADFVTANDFVCTLAE